VAILTQLADFALRYKFQTRQTGGVRGMTSRTARGGFVRRLPRRQIKMIVSVHRAIATLARRENLRVTFYTGFVTERIRRDCRAMVIAARIVEQIARALLQTDDAPKRSASAMTINARDFFGGVCGREIGWIFL
jgi:hypothetical protein